VLKLRSLRSRNIALLVVVVLAGQLLAMLLVWFLAVRPQTERVGAIMARNVAAISMTIDRLPQGERDKLIAKINADGAIRLLPGTATPPEDRSVPTLVEAVFMRAFVAEMRQKDALLWRGGEKGQMWAQVRLGGQPYWISNERPKGWSPNGTILFSFLTAISLALVAGILLQRHVAQPLRKLAAAADTVTPDGFPEMLSTDGPSEIAAVARSFNLMGERLAAQDAERTMMLAGVSHDLRTPLAKIRLSLAMEPNLSSDADALVSRQLDRLDMMLGQFLDFARGVDGELFGPVDLELLAQTCVEELDVKVPIVCEIATQIRGRPIAIQRAIANLLRNATFYGAPPVTIRIEARGDDVGVVVSDQGEGVDPAMIDILTRPFVRGDAARGGAAGTGLGLAIARQVAEQHGGRLILASEKDAGFSATLMLRRV
jgi:two-component system, OmpR family, osmolarity sensor histidine kinase EnvZ